MRGMALTRVAFEHLSAELERLRTERAELDERLVRDGTSGDVGDQAAKVELVEARERLQARIAELTRRLGGAEIVEVTTTDVVVEGVTVTLAFADGATEHYLVGAVDTAEPGAAVVTPTSPLGRALLGARVGAVLRWSAPRGEMCATVVGIG